MLTPHKHKNSMIFKTINMENLLQNQINSYEFIKKVNRNGNYSYSYDSVLLETAKEVYPKYIQDPQSFLSLLNE